jgi:hypothetical protein
VGRDSVHVLQLVSVTSLAVVSDAHDGVVKAAIVDHAIDVHREGAAESKLHGCARLAGLAEVLRVRGARDRLDEL